MQSSQAPHRVLVWELPVRLFHWTIFALVVSAYVTWRANWMDWHVWIGYAAMTAVLFRILWGFFGGDCARLAHFLTGPRAAVAHLRHVLRREPDLQVGHNAAGGWMVMLLLGLLLAETLSGLLLYNDIADEGPLTELLPAQLGTAITAAHAIVWDVLLGAACVHVAAILLYACMKRQNLVMPMITGRKSLPPELAAPRRGGTLRAIVLLGISALAVTALARYL